MRQSSVFGEQPLFDHCRDIVDDLPSSMSGLLQDGVIFWQLLGLGPLFGLARWISLHGQCAMRLTD